jgi:hypothetical protein
MWILGIRTQALSTVKHYVERELFEASIEPLPLKLWEPSGRGGRTVGAKGVEDIRRTQDLWDQLRSIHRGLRRLKQQSWSLHESVLGPLCMCYGYWLDILGRLLAVGVEVSLSPLPAPRILFLLLGFPALMGGSVSTFIVSSCARSVDIPGRPALFWGKKGRLVWIWGKGESEENWEE